MASLRPKIAIFGAGLIGIYAGGTLAPVADVTLIGKAPLMDPLSAGLILTDNDENKLDLHPNHFQATTDQAALAQADMIIVAVKSQATDDAIRAIRTYARSDALVLSFQNGVSNTDHMRANLPHTVLAGMVGFNVAQLGPNHYHRGAGSGIMVEAHPALDAYLPLFAKAGLPLEARADIKQVQWGKLLINLNNAVNALAGVSLAQTIMQRDYRCAWALSLVEALEILEAANIQPLDAISTPIHLMPEILRTSDDLYRFISTATATAKTRVDPHAKTSMAVDLDRGRKTEVDYLQGEVVRLAESIGRKAPVNAKLVELIRFAENGASPIPAEQLHALLLEARTA